MADEMRLRVAVETSAAQDALGKLADAQAGLARSTDKAATETQKLARQTAEAAAAANVAREATAKATRAQAEAAAVAQAFGKDSREAAEAQERLRVAQEAATRATRAAERALEDAAQAVTEAAKTADAKGTPAVKRMADQIQRAGKDAEKTAQDLRVLESRIESASKGADEGREKFSAMMAGVAAGVGFKLLDKGLEKLKDAVAWAIEHNEKLGKSYASLTTEAEKFGLSVTEGAFGRALGLMLDAGSASLGWVSEFSAELRTATNELGTASERLEAYARAHKGAIGPLGEMLEKTYLFGQAQRDLNAARREGERAMYDAARREDALAALREREQARTNDARARDRLARDANADRAKRAASARPAADLSAAPSFRGIDDAAGVYASDQLVVGAEVDAFERESAIREERLAMIDREIEAQEAAGLATTAAVDHRIAEEERLAKWQRDNAVTIADRERATTRLEDVEHRKRLVQARRAVDAEAKEQERRQGVIENVAGAVTMLGEGMVDAFEAMAAGQKGAVAEMLADLLKSIAKQHAVLALAETAKGVAAQATTWGIPNPAAIGHYTAAGLHAGVAVAAGVGSYAAGQVADARGAGASGGAAAEPTTTPLGGEAGSTSTRSGGGGGGGLDAQDVPISHSGLGGGTPRATAAVVVNIINPTIAGAGGVKQLAATIQSEIERMNRGGPRPRN